MFGPIPEIVTSLYASLHRRKMADTVEEAVKDFMVKFERPVSGDDLKQRFSQDDMCSVLDKLVSNGFIQCKSFSRADSSTDEITIFWKSHLFIGNKKLLPMKRPFEGPSTPATPAAVTQCSRSKVRTPFRTPRRVGLSAQKGISMGAREKFRSPSASRTQDDVARSVFKLQAEVDQVKHQLTPLLAVYSEEDVQRYIDALHEYNEVKDVAQTLLGKYAELEQTTVAQAHEKFGLGVED